MRTLTALLFLAAVCAAGEAGGADKEPSFEWRQLHGSATHANYRERKNSVTVPKVLWHRPEAVGQPTLSGGWLYCGGPVLGRIAARTGKFERSPQANGLAVGASPVLTDSVVVVRRPDGVVHAYTRDLRRLIWESTTNAPAVHMDHPAAMHGEYYVINEGSGVRALRVRDGKTAWRFRSREGEVALTPAIAKGRVFFGSVGGNAWAVELTSGKQLWKLTTRTGFGWSNPVVAGGTLYFADRGVQIAGEPTTSGRLNAIDPGSGRIQWRTDYGKNWSGTPATDGKRVVLGTIRKVMQFERKTGREPQPPIALDQWSFGTPAIVGKTLYFGTSDGYLHARDLRTSDLKWRLRVPGVQPNGKPHDVRSIVHTGSLIYVETSNGLYCLGQDPNRRGVRPQGETIEAKE